MQRINITRELHDSIRKPGPTGRHSEIVNLQKGLGAHTTPGGAISFY